MWQKGRYIWKISGRPGNIGPCGVYPAGIRRVSGASGDIELIEVFSILSLDGHENKYFKHPVNLRQLQPQKNTGWDMIHTLLLKVENSGFSEVIYVFLWDFLCLQFSWIWIFLVHCWQKQLSTLAQHSDERHTMCLHICAAIKMYFS